MTLIRDKKTATAKEILDRKKASQRWMGANYYDEWAQVAKSYRCERDPEEGPDGEVDEEATSLGTPLTAAFANRAVARITANLPNIKLRGKDRSLSELISRKLMYDWDRGRVQRQQKMHARQAVLFGWSVRAWHWAVEEADRKKRVDPNHHNPEIRIASLREIDEFYKIPQEFGGVSLADLVSSGNPNAEAEAQEIISALLAEYGRGMLLPIQYPYKYYEGPKCETLCVADVFPEPLFTSIQDSNYFIIERRRNEGWIRKFLLAYQDRFPELVDGFNRLLHEHPRGTSADYQTRAGSNAEYGNLRQSLLDAYADKDYFNELSRTEDTNTWTITEEHVPGRKPVLRFVGEDGIMIGEIPYPYDLEGKVAFTELTLIDDILFGGVGDSVLRFARGLQQLHDRSVCIRADLNDTLSRPLIGTTNDELYDDVSQIKRFRGFRLFKARSQNDMWVQPEQAAMAAASQSMAGNSEIIQLWQMITGENNMSQVANVDPQQARTATGARIMAYIGDVLSKDMLDMYTQTSLIPDAEMMFLLNRSEMTEPIEFESSRYNRSYRGDQAPTVKEQWTTVEPLMFQIDAEIWVETGSTLADDDESKLQKAMTLWGVASQRPDLFNQQKARDEFLIAMGKGNELDQWAAPPPQPPPPPPPEQPKVSLSVSMPFPQIVPQLQERIAQKVGLLAPGEQLQQPPMIGPDGQLIQMEGGPEGPPPTGGPGPEGPPPMMGGPGGPPPQLPPELAGEDGVPGMMVPEDQDLGIGAYAASRGKNPLRDGEVLA